MHTSFSPGCQCSKGKPRFDLWLRAAWQYLAFALPGRPEPQSWRRPAILDTHPESTRSLFPTRLAISRRRLDGTSRCGAKAATVGGAVSRIFRSEEHTSELQSHVNLVCRLLLEKKKKNIKRKHLDRYNKFTH